MESMPLYLIPIYFIIYTIVGTLLTRYFAKVNEWDTSYKTAFSVIIIWVAVTFTISLIIELLTGNLSFTEAQIFISIVFYILILIISYSTFLIFGPLLVKKFYETEFRESFSLVLKVLLYEAIILTPLISIVYIFI